jgi:CspA family cold shock protein
MATSKVKWFDAKKGYGFIENPVGGSDIFVHYTAIISGQQFKILEPGVAVDFEFEDTAKGLQARNVRELGTHPDIQSTRFVKAS